MPCLGIFNKIQESSSFWCCMDITEFFNGGLLGVIQHTLLLCTPWYKFLPESYSRAQVQTALDLVKNKNTADKAVWKKITKSEYRRCAVVESYESIRHILVNRILRLNSADQILVKTLFEDHIDRAINQRKFTVAFSLTKLPEVHKCVLTLVKSIVAHEADEVPSDLFSNMQESDVALPFLLCRPIRESDFSQCGSKC